MKAQEHSQHCRSSVPVPLSTVRGGGLLLEDENQSNGSRNGKLSVRLQAQYNSMEAAESKIKRLEAELSEVIRRLYDKVSEDQEQTLQVKSLVTAELQTQRTVATLADREIQRLSGIINTAILLFTEILGNNDEAEQPKTLTDAASQLQAELQKLRKEFDEPSILRQASTQEEKCKTRLEQDNDRLHAELGELTRRLVQSQHDCETTRHTLEKAQQKNDAIGHQILQLEAQIKIERLAAKECTAAIVGNTKRLIQAFSPAQLSRVRVALSPTLKGIIRRIKASGVVDDDWYLKKNPDVREAGLDPTRHYVLYGAAEHRLPRDMSKIT